MESQKINILLQKYFEAETTLEEENELINYFNSDKVDEALQNYVPLFSGLKKFSKEEIPDLSNELMNHIIKSEHKNKLQFRWRIGIITAVAASVIMGLLAVNFSSHPKPSKVIADDQREAYEEVVKAFGYLSGEYKESMAELAPLKKINEAAEPIQSGINEVNEGFSQMKEIKKINKEFKK